MRKKSVLNAQDVMVETDERLLSEVGFFFYITKSIVNA